MPGINRIRIINFSFNNDKRHIVDETFEFHGGENALLTMENGGGKSVLVQMAMQPIIPMVRLQGRNVRGFFKNRKPPTYILLEWKLDDMGGYLLTGICIASRESQTKDTGDAGNSIRYFTFTSHYHESDLFDISNIPLCEKEGKTLRVLTYKEAASLISERSRIQEGDVGYFAQDERKQYADLLMTYNISQDEWKNIIARINSDEGGVIEIFEKCRTAGQLMREWILATVEKAIYEDIEDQGKLASMLENLVEEMIVNEQYIHEKKILEEFSGQLGEFALLLKSLVEGLEEQRDIEKRLASILRYFEKQRSLLDEDICRLDDEVSEFSRLIRHIELERRSFEYHQAKDGFEKSSKAFLDSSEKLQAAKERSDKLKSELAVQKAAEIYEEILEQKALLGAIEEEISKLRGDTKQQERIDSLEFSLKKACSEKLEVIKTRIISLKAALEARVKEMEKKRAAIYEAEKETEALNRKAGKCQSLEESFLRYEEETREFVGFSTERNLLKEISENDHEKIKRHLAKEMELKKSRLTELLDESEALKKKLELLHKKILDSTKKQGEQKRNLEEQIKEIEKYHSMQKKLKGIFERQGLDIERRFEHAANLVKLDERSDEIGSAIMEVKNNIEKNSRMIRSLKRGTLHVSLEYAAFLEEKDIDFETGETYLRKQKAGIKEKLLENLPLLPYAFIVKDSDLTRIKYDSPSVPLYQPVPVISYSALGQPFVTSAGTLLLCPYDKKMINAEDMGQYILELEAASEEQQKLCSHYTDVRNILLDDINIVKEAVYGAGYIEELEKSFEAAKKALEQEEKLQEVMETDIESVGKRISDLAETTSETKIDIERMEHKIKRFEEYLLRDIQYVKTVREHEKCLKDLDELSKIKSDAQEYNDEAAKENYADKTAIDRLYSEEDTYKKKYESYRNAKEAALTELSIMEMEAMLRSLKEEIDRSFTEMERDKEIRLKEIDRKNRELVKTGVTGDVYEKTQFDKILQANLEKEFNDSEQLKTEWEQKNKEDEINKAVAENKVENAMSEVRSLTDEGPLDKEQIKMDFEGRTAETKRLMSQKQQRISNLEKEKAGYLDISQRIESVVGPEKYDIEEIGTIEEDIKEAAGKGVVKLRELKGSNSAQERTIDHMYSKLAGLYKDKNVNIAGIFKGLDPIQHQAAGDADQYYYLYERTLYQKDTLSDMIRIYETQLANLERNKNDMIMQSYHHAMRLYEEIGKITKDSAINIEGRSRPVNMIKINLEEPEEKITGLDKMRKYIESCVIGLKDDTDKENKKEDIRRSINSQMSAWELLNVISDLSCLSIEAFKIDINVNNSRYKTWEQVMKENSGGERFVSFFAILAALIAYTRKSIRNDDFNAMDRGTKVIIMDNPFGPISSEHLLKPMFDIAKKYRTQLICLTGLKQNSILNCFNLVYMLRIRTSAFGTEEYIKIEGNIRDESSIQRDEKLEKAVFKASEYKQLELI